MRSTVERFSSGLYTVTRRAPGSTEKGRAVPGPRTTFKALMSVQPLKGSELQRLPEGMRSSEVRVVFSPVELRTQGAQGEPDSIRIEGADWEVQTVEDWRSYGGFWKALAQKVGR